jgi:nicotinate phosphoribosyltransferase
MSHLKSLYARPLALLTDLYQLTMAYGYWKAGMTHKEAVFHLAFRTPPFRSGFTIACGLHTAQELLNNFRFPEDDLRYLAGLTGNDGSPLFEEGFLSYLSTMAFSCNMDAVPEGTVVFPHEPLLRVTGPLLQCQLLETPLLNCLNFQSLIATKSARICLAARGEPVLEFGLRRAQGIDGALTASRAAYVGGCAATSNVLAGKMFGIPVRGTHAHSWVMCFDDEPAAFEAYARALPNNCVFLVDTYDTIQGVRHAVDMGIRLRRQGHELAGIRLDSGDLAALSIEARRILDEAGFPGVSIIASNDLDEQIISSLKQQRAAISVWGVGTKLATAYDHPALDGVYKLSAIRDPGRPWTYRVKLSEQEAKISTPGVLQVRRFTRQEEPVADIIFDENRPPDRDWTRVDPMDTTRQIETQDATGSEDLLVPVFRQGTAVYDPPPVSSVRDRTLGQLSRFHEGIKRLVNPHTFPVGLEKGLYEIKARLVREAREQGDPKQ